MTSRRTELRRHLDAPPEVVYRALTDPVAVAHWMVPDGMTSEVHEFEAREGGAWRSKSWRGMSAADLPERSDLARPRGA